VSERGSQEGGRERQRASKSELGPVPQSQPAPARSVFSFKDLGPVRNRR
jgi:hypothetical protein